MLRGPVEVGFDYYYGIAASLGMPPHGYIENHKLVGELGDILVSGKKGKPSDKEHPLFQCRPGQSMKGFHVRKVLKTFTEKAVSYIKEKAKTKKPFFMYFSLSNTPRL